MSPRVRAALPALLALAVVVPLAVSGAAAGLQSSHPAAASQGDVSVDRTVFFVQLEPDGNATWRVSYHFSVTTDDERAAFEELANRFEGGDVTLSTTQVIRQGAERASVATGRNMTVTEPERSSDVDNGTLTVSMTWTNFAREEDGDYHVGDAFNTSDGPWFGGLTEDQTLVMAVPDGYGIRSAPKRSQNGQIRWDGPQEFTLPDLSLTYIGNGPTGGDQFTDRTDSGSETTTAPIDPETGDAVIWGGFLALALGIVVVGVYVLSRRDGGVPAGGPFGADPDGPATPAGEPPVADPAPEPEDDGIDEELLSDEERVERLLDRNGGRMKQADIVKETDWSNAKVSQLLSSMEEEDRIDKLRIGRENLISFPDEDLTDIEE